MSGRRQCGLVGRERAHDWEGHQWRTDDLERDEAVLDRPLGARRRPAVPAREEAPDESVSPWSSMVDRYYARVKARPECGSSDAAQDASPPVLRSGVTSALQTVDTSTDTGATTGTDDTQGDVTPKRNTALGIALAASVEKEISTESIRILLGIHDRVAARLARPDATAAFIPLREVYAYSGVKGHTVPGHLASLERLGIEQVDAGAAGKMVDDHGIATAWDFVTPDIKPFPCEPRLRKFLDPALTLWAKDQAGTAGYRIALALIALFGTTTTPINASMLADVLGVNRSNVSRSLARLAEASRLVAKEGRSWSYTPTYLAFALSHSDDSYLDWREVGSRFDRMDRADEVWRPARKVAVARKRGADRLREHLALPPLEPQYPEPGPTEDW